MQKAHAGLRLICVLIAPALALTAIPAASIRPQEPIQITLAAVDLDGDTLQYTAQALPEGASFDPETRVFSWTPREDQVGRYVVRFTVSDGELSDYEDVTISVFHPCDINQDWRVDILDLILVSQHFGESWVP
jgi:hypothetical protein